MESNSIEEQTTVGAESVFVAALKLLGIYLLYNAILQSGTLMGAIFNVSQLLTNASAMAPFQWVQLATSLFSTMLTLGMAIILIQHGDRAAHWFMLRSDWEIPITNPTAKWFSGALGFTGVWVLATQLPTTFSYAAWFIANAFDREGMNIGPNPVLSGLISFMNSAVVLGVAFGLIFYAQRLGDWLYKVTIADGNDPTETA